jgi:hypothetical protein
LFASAALALFGFMKMKTNEIAESPRAGDLLEKESRATRKFSFRCYLVERQLISNGEMRRRMRGNALAALNRLDCFSRPLSLAINRLSRSNRERKKSAFPPHRMTTASNHNI